MRSAVRSFVLILLTVLPVFGSPPVGEQRGVLVYLDGNRLTGVLLDDSGGNLVFRSDRFGQIVALAEEARFEPVSLPAPSKPAPRLGVGLAEEPATSPVAPATKSAAPPAGSKLAGATPPAAGAQVARSPFDPWKARFNAYYDRNTSSGGSRTEYFLGTRFERPVGGDRVIFDLRAEYAKRGEVIDKRRVTLNGDWRHTLDERWFLLYRPFGESALGTIKPYGRVDYWLTQQQLGPAYKWLAAPKLDGAFGPAINYHHLEIPDRGFGRDTWFLSIWAEHSIDLTQGWRLNQRGQFYIYRGHEVGWESEFDLTKRLGRHFSVTLRREYRKNYPQLDATDIRRTRVLFGLEF